MALFILKLVNRFTTVLSTKILSKKSNISDTRRMLKRLKIIICVIFFVFTIPVFCTTMSAAQAKVYRENFVSMAKQKVGSPYVYGAVGPDTFDCSGLIYFCAREAANKQLPRTAKALYSYCRIVKDSNREVGDLLFFKTTASGNVSHVGIYIGNNQFISAISDGPNTGVIISSLKQDYWKGKYIGAGQFLPSGKSGFEDEEDIIEEIAVLDSNSSDRTSSSSGKSGNFKGSSFYNSNASWKDSIVFDGSVSASWSFISPKRFLFMFRGIDSSFNARITKWPLEPGLGFGFKWSAGTDVFQFPILLSFTLNDFVRFYAGPVFTAGNAKLVDTDKDISASIFPGIIGVSFSTPAIDAGKVKLQFVQDINYSVFNNTGGGALPILESVSAGLVFHTGIRVLLPLNAFF